MLLCSYNTMVTKYKYILILSIPIIVIIYLYFSTYLNEQQNVRYIKYTNSYDMSHIFDLEFDYIISNNCTDSRAIRAIQIVTSFAGNVEARSALRRAYPKEELLRLGIYRVFLLSVLKPGVSEVTQNAILDENKRFYDIIQGNFQENYRNLTYKHIMGLRWTVMKCNAPCVIKMDDDIIVDMYALMDLINYKQTERFDIMGYVFKDMRPIRIKSNKWYVKKEEYSSSSYPQFVSGWLYVLTLEAAEKLISSLGNENYFWIDDVFVTGVLAKKANLRQMDMQKYFTTNPEYFECCIRDQVACGFIIGPSGGDYNININFQQHAKLCHEMRCLNYTNGKTFKNSCIVQRKIPEIKKGFAQLDVIKL